jgi:hypothetical protein
MDGMGKGDSDSLGADLARINERDFCGRICGNTVELGVWEEKLGDPAFPIPDRDIRRTSRVPTASIERVGQEIMRAITGGGWIHYIISLQQIQLALILPLVGIRTWADLPSDTILNTIQFVFNHPLLPQSHAGSLANRRHGSALGHTTSIVF